jgi:predicted DNA-binding protein
MLVANQNKDVSIQIRLPAEIKKKIASRASNSGLSISEYARTVLLLTSGVLKEEMDNFWKETMEIEKEYKAGKYISTSAEDLIKLGRQARNAN